MAFVVVLAISAPVHSQTAANVVSGAPQNWFAKWTLLNGDGNDFFFAMPEGSSLFVDSNFRLNDVFDARVDSYKQITRSINGVFLSVTLYKGAARDVARILLKEESQKIKALKEKQAGANLFSIVKNKYSYQEKTRQSAEIMSGIILTTTLNEKLEAKPEIVKIAAQPDQTITFEQKNAPDEERNGFECNFFVFKSPEYVSEKQYYLYQNSLYVVEATARTETNSIFRSFLDSIRLVKGNVVLSPNQAKPAEDFAQAKMKLPPQILERNFDEAYLSQVKSIGEITKQSKINFVPMPAATRTNSIFDDISSQIKIGFRYKLKLTLLANGKVGEIEVLERNIQKSAPISDATVKKFEENTVKAFKNANFIPAEKDGKAVSTQKIVEYLLEIQ